MDPRWMSGSPTSWYPNTATQALHTIQDRLDYHRVIRI